MFDPGICRECLHSRIITSDRGSQFYWCGRSKDDPKFPKYPRLPLRFCPGFEQNPDVPPANPDDEELL